MTASPPTQSAPDGMTIEMIEAGIASLGSDDDRSSGEVALDCWDAMNSARGSAPDAEAVIAELRAAESQLAFLAEGCGVPGLTTYQPEAAAIAAAISRADRIDALEAENARLREGPPLKDLLQAYERGEREAGPADHLAGNPTLWPSTRGMLATRELWRSFGISPAPSAQEAKP